MISKDILLEMVRDGLENGSLTKADLTQFVDQAKAGDVAEPQLAKSTSAPAKQTHEDESANKSLSVIDALFYLAGIILFAALGAAVAEVGSVSVLSSVILLVPGVLFWAGAYLFSKRPEQSENVKGLINALVLAGCLSVVSGGMVAASQLAGNANDASSAYVIATALAIFGGVQLAYDRIFRHAIPVVLGMYMLVAAFPTVLVGLLSSSNPPVDVWTVIGMATGVLVGYGGVISSKTAPGRGYLKGAFYPVAGFAILGSAYVASLVSEAAVVWQIILPLLIYGAFFYSIKRRSQNFLLTGAAFLALFLITISFKYFVGLGASFCLILSAVALLGTAFLAININKRYIKQA